MPPAALRGAAGPPGAPRKVPESPARLAPLTLSAERHCHARRLPCKRTRPENSQTLLCDVVDEQRAHRPAVVRAGDGPVPLLAGCVPNLRLDRLPVDLWPRPVSAACDPGLQAPGQSRA